MALAGGVLSAGIGALSALLSPSTKSKTGVSSGASFDIGNSTQATQAGASQPTAALSPATFIAALSAQSDASASSLVNSSSDKASAMQRLFGALDADGSGEISNAEFQQQLGAGGTNTANADKVFGKIDANGDGSISMDELASALTASKKKRAPQHGQGSQDPLLKALDAAYQKTKNLSASSTSTVSVAA